MRQAAPDDLAPELYGLPRPGCGPTCHSLHGRPFKGDPMCGLAAIRAFAGIYRQKLTNSSENGLSIEVQRALRGAPGERGEVEGLRGRGREGRGLSNL